MYTGQLLIAIKEKNFLQDIDYLNNIKISKHDAILKL